MSDAPASARTEGSPEPEPPAAGTRRGRAGGALHWQILLGLLVGGIAGLLANALCPPGPDGTPHAGLTWAVNNVATPLGQIFMRLIFMVVLPLVFTALVLGVAGLGDVRQLGRVGLRTLIYTVAFSACSVAIGVTLANTVRPGLHLGAEQRRALNERYAGQATEKVAQAHQAKSLRDALLDVIPRNPVQEMVGALDGSSPGGGMLAVMFFALVFGVAMSLAPQRTAPLIPVLEAVYHTVLVVVGFAMRLAPLGVAGLMFALTAFLGFDILKMLGWYVLTVLCGLLVHFVVVYSVALRGVAGLNPLRFFRQTSEAIVTAFATSSSNATLPTALRVAEYNVGLRREIASFVLTVGSTANQNGTALYEGVTVLFLAQVFGVDLTLGQQVTVAVMSVLAGIGTAGVPGGSLPLVIMVLQSVGVPAEGIGIILGVDRLLDMCRTTVNVVGDIAIAACVNRST
ncbi:MAG TPA: dicarboxylate/amino acid:cation symporter [Phycisphaerae bacterium]|nr:dicarboxylate/amino acid:cation symporter [Phycisphaerae bacterium]HNU46382.1 dicarboxylate/amino acid:cation symporter [Phycisphaerae bacterium]